MEQKIYIHHYFKILVKHIKGLDIDCACEIIAWIEEYSPKIFKIDSVYKKENDDVKQCRKFIKKWFKKIDKLILDPQFNMSIWSKSKVISDAFSLSKAEKKVLVFILLSEQYIAINKLMFILAQYSQVYTNIIASNDKELGSDLKHLFTDKQSVLMNGMMHVKHKAMTMSYALFRIYNTECKHISDVRNILLAECKTSKKMDDFKSVSNSYTIIAKRLKQAIIHRDRGVNIILYGVPSFYKTALPATICKDVHARLSSLVANRNGVNAENKVSELILAQAYFKGTHRNVILFNNADEVLSNAKLATNKLIINNPVPVIWIVDDIENVNASFIEQCSDVMDMSLAGADCGFQVG